MEFKVFLENYAPDRIKGYKGEPRTLEELSEVKATLRPLALEVDKKRLADPGAGVGLAANEIFRITLREFDGRVCAEMTAALSAVGGRECMRGIIGALKAIPGDVMANAGALSIIIADTESGGKYLFGDLAGNEFCVFYMTAAGSPESPIERLKPIAETASRTVGTDKYWDTPCAVEKSPMELADGFDGDCDNILGVYCRYRAERMLAFAGALQLTLKAAESEAAREQWLNIIAEYGWRTSHFIGAKL